MLGKGFSILLMATILACPLVCGQGACPCVEHADQTESPACCEKCDGSCTADESQAEEQNEHPQPPCDGPCDDCQCICGGAIFKDSSHFALLLQFAAEIDAFSCETLPAGLNAVDGRSPADPFPDDRRVSSGRVVCSLHMSFLC